MRTEPNCRATVFSLKVLVGCRLGGVDGDVGNSNRCAQLGKRGAFLGVGVPAVNHDPGELIVSCVQCNEER